MGLQRSCQRQSRHGSSGVPGGGFSGGFARVRVYCRQMFSPPGLPRLSRADGWLHIAQEVLGAPGRLAAALLWEAQLPFSLSRRTPQLPLAKPGPLSPQPPARLAVWLAGSTAEGLARPLITPSVSYANSPASGFIECFPYCKHFSGSSGTQFPGKRDGGPMPAPPSLVAG